MNAKDTNAMESTQKPDIDISRFLELKHASMRARDRQRIESGEATPQEIQKENAMFQFDSFQILNFTY